MRRRKTRASRTICLTSKKTSQKTAQKGAWAEGVPPRSEKAKANVERVQALVKSIPPGNVTTYGEIGKATGVGARYVGWVMRVHGADLPWWRVLRADGSPHDPERVWPRWEDEGIGKLASGKADMREHGLDARDLRALVHRKED